MALTQLESATPRLFSYDSKSFANMEIQTSNFRKQIDIGDYKLPTSPK